jgi:tRNA (mo5U34)-methyltransferase
MSSRQLEDLLAEARAEQWYHCLELAPGYVTAGEFDMRPFTDRYGLPADMTGMRAIDVGPFDGFWAFEMERRGADVVVLDTDQAQLDWPPRIRPSGYHPTGRTLQIAHAIYGSAIERINLPIYEATPEQVGTFDLVFCGSVLMHLRDPMLALFRLADLCRDQLVLCEEYSPRAELLPLRGAAEFRGNLPWMTWWLPASRTWLEMVQIAGFEAVKRRARFSIPFRTKRKHVPHVLIHADGPARSATGGGLSPAFAK